MLTEIRQARSDYAQRTGLWPTVVRLHPMHWYEAQEEASHGETLGSYTLMGMSVELDPTLAAPQLS